MVLLGIMELVQVATTMIRGTVELLEVVTEAERAEVGLEVGQRRMA
jgi:hypothetical protein